MIKKLATNINSSLSGLLLYITAMPIVVAADPDAKALLNNPFIGSLINTIQILIVSVAILISIIGGYTYMTSGGSPDRINLAKSLFKDAVIGILALAFARIFARMVGVGI